MTDESKQRTDVLSHFLNSHVGREINVYLGDYDFESDQYIVMEGILRNFDEKFIHINTKVDDTIISLRHVIYISAGKNENVVIVKRKKEAKA